jgi:hypothetical protein
MKVKTILLSTIIINNIKDGKLEAGWYEVAFDGIHTIIPLYREYDGTMWKAMGDPITYYGRTMTVFDKLTRAPNREFYEY